MKGKSLNGYKFRISKSKNQTQKKGEKSSKHLQDSENYIGQLGSPGEIKA